jgi:hypothetical protein
MPSRFGSKAERKGGRILAERGERATPTDSLMRGSALEPRDVPTLADLGTSSGEKVKDPARQSV